MLIIDEWEEIRLLLADWQQVDENELTLVMYGLFQNSLGTRSITAQPTIEDVRNRAMEAWQEYFRPGTVAYLHLVKPQRNLAGREVHFIIEFSNRFFEVPAGDIPVVRKIYWEGVWTEAEPIAAYHTQGISTFQLLIQIGLMEWCGPDTRTECNIHIEGRITLPLVQVELNKGSMMEIFIHFGAIESDAITLVQSHIQALSPKPQDAPTPRRYAGDEGASPARGHGSGQAASSSSGNGHTDDSISPSNPGSEEESSGSDYDPDSYGWDDELPQGLVKVACFKRGPSQESDPILSIVSMRREEDLHDQLAVLYRMPARFIKGILFVAPSPDFAEEQGAWPIIVEQTQDRHDAATQKLVVLQVDYYYSKASTGDQATQWRVVILPNVASRMEVIAATDALNYCEALADSRCLVWHHRELWSQQGPDHIISDGDLIRVAVPPIDEDMCESTWIRVQDTYDAGRLVGFPPENSDEEYQELTPRSSMTGLRSSSTSDISDGDGDMQDRLRPYSLQQHATDASSSRVGSSADFTQNPSSGSAAHLVANHHSQAHFGQSKLYPEEEWTTEAPNGEVQTGYAVVLYGLFWEDVGTRFANVPCLNLLSLEEAVHQQWPNLVHYQKNLFRIDPQPNGATFYEVHILVEFLDSADYPHPALEPVLEVLHLWKRDGTFEEIRQPAYHHSYSNLRQVLHGLGKWCDYDRHYYCEAWIKGQSLQEEEQQRLHPGDLVTIRLTPKTERLPTRTTSLLQHGAALRRKFTIPLAHYLGSNEKAPQQRSVSLSIEPAQLCNFIAAWRDAPLGCIYELPDGTELPVATCEALDKANGCQKGITYATHIFTDGSYDSNSETMAWSFVVLKTDKSDYTTANIIHLLGYACGIVETSSHSPQWKGANKCNAYVAEVEALLQSHWWALAHEVGPEVHFHFDAKSAGYGVKGLWGHDSSHQLCGLARAIAQSLEICVGSPISYHHIRAHSGDPWNELVDAVANGCRTGSIKPTRPPDFDLRPWIQGGYVLPAEHLPLALQVLQGHPGLPSGTVNSLSYAANLGRPPSTDALWPIDLDQQQGTTTGQHQAAALRCCSYNVRTLKEDASTTCAGSAEYLRTQLTALEYHVCALQETRAKESATIESGDFIRLVAGSDNGRGGCELWFSKTHKIGSFEACTLQHLTVLHQEASLLVVRQRIGCEFLVFVSAHAPHSGHAEEDRNQWWAKLAKVLEHAKLRGRLVLCGDFNAQLGDPVEGAIGDLVEGKTTPNGVHFGSLLQRLGLWAPSTYSHCHGGQHGTWTHPNTRQAIRIDFIAIDLRFGAFGVTSLVDHNIDTSGLGEDHDPVQVHFSFATWKQRSARRRVPIDEVAITDAANRSQVEAAMQAVSTIAWEENVHDHYAAIAKELYNNLVELFPQQRKQPRKHYISQQTWMCRASKVVLKQALRAARKQNDSEGESILLPQLRDISQRLRRMLQEDRAQHVRELLEQVDKAPPHQIFAQLKRLGIGARFRKTTTKALPMMKKNDGTYAGSFEESQEVWRQYAAALEGGHPIDGGELLSRCFERQRRQLEEGYGPLGVHIPTRIQVERACRKLKPFKARGPDGLPAGLFHCYPATTAALLHPLFVKFVCQGAEPLGFKGGRLVHLFKGKGAADEPENRRGILISNHVGKIAHSTLRGQYTPFLELGMLPMQVGGRPRKSVQQGAHMLRLFMSCCKQHNLSCGVVFLDIRTAYYKVLRELVTSQPVPEDRIKALLAHFRLPPESMQQLETKLRGDDGTLRTGLGSSMGQILGELHSDTWFTTQGLPGLTVTTIGTRPGSCFADVFFNFLFAEVLKEIKATLGDSGVLTELRWCGKRNLDMDMQNEDCTTNVLETAWADDLALFFQHQDPNQLVTNLQEGCATMINTCMKYGLEPNFARGKTEAILSLRGKGAVHARRKWFTDERGLLPLPDCHLEGCHIKLVARYRHLGGIVDAKANTTAEVKARVGQMKQTFRRYKKTLFASTSIDRLRRAQLLRPLVLSILEFNLGALVDMREADYRYIATSILGIYRAILIGSRSGDPDEYKTKWARICYTLQLPTPMAIVHMARIRYFGQVFRAGGDDLWAAISGQRTWLSDCREAFQWLYTQICNTSTLPDPAVDWQPWEAMLSTQKKRFAGLVQRAWRHEIIQDYNQCIVQEGYTGFYMALELGNYEFPDSITTAIVPQEPPDHSKVHACLQCQKVFESRTAWASHAFKKHQRKNPARRFTCGTYCLACGKEFWEYKRLLMHHKYSGECRRRLAMASYTVQDDEIAPGMGSRAQRQQPEDILQPWTIVPSADLPVRNYWAGVENSWDSELLDALFLAIPLDDGQIPLAVDDLLETLRHLLIGTTVEYGSMLRTILCWKDSMMDVSQQSDQCSPHRAGLIKAFFVALGQVDMLSWLIPHRQEEQLLPKCDWKELFDGELAFHNGWPRVEPEVYWFKTMFIIHFFSGRRRTGDLQSFLDTVVCSGIHLCVLSVDIIFGGGADMAKREVQQRWLEMMAMGYVLAFFAGPPCETYSRARANEINGINIRPIRSATYPWGFGSLSLREAAQVLIGNILVLFVLQAAAIQAATGHFACIEHPAEPIGPAHHDSVSIWKLSLMQQLCRHSRVQLCTVQQGRYGAPSPKPTGLLFVGPAAPRTTLEKHASKHCARGTTIGLSNDGKTFQTAKLKEYPQGLCFALTEVLKEWIREQEQIDVAEEPTSATLQYVAAFQQSLDVQTERMGPDFNPAAQAI